MSIFDQHTETEEQDYHFASGTDINDYLSEMGAEKQDMNLSDTLDEDLPFDTETEEQTMQMPSDVANATGKMFASVIDTVLPETLAMLSKGDVEDYKAAPTDRKELEKALGKYLAIKGTDIPPGVMLLILILSIYGMKVPQALQERKFNNKMQELEAREKALQEREARLNDTTTEGEWLWREQQEAQY